ncbi:hypothetical protein Tco_0585607, partial [Tanacetum coccineum]
TFQLVDEAQQESIPQEEGDDPDLELAKFILVRHDQAPHDSTTGPSSQHEDDTSEKVVHESSSTTNSERTESGTKAAAPKGDKEQGEVASSTMTSGVGISVRTEDQAGSDLRKAHEAMARPDPEPMQEDQTGLDSGKVHVSLAGPNPEHMDEEFLATAYPNVHENLKLIINEHVIEDNPESHSGSMSSMKNLEDTDNFGDQFLYDKPTEDDQEKSKVVDESDITIPDPSHPTVTSTPLVITLVIDFSSPKPSSLVTPPPINTEATTITTSLLKITPFIALQLRVARLEQEMSEVKKIDHSAAILDSIKSQVPIVVDNYLGTKLDDALLRILERHTADLIEKYSVLPGPESIKNQESKKSPKEIIRIKREQEALIADEDTMYKEVKDRVKDYKRKHDSDNDEDDDDDDEGPSAGSNHGKSTKRRRHDSGASGSAQPPPKDDEQSSKKPQDSDASASKQHPTLTSTGWQITNTRDAVIDSSMHRSEPESGHSEHSSDDVSKQDEGHVSDLEDTDNAHIPKVTAATWFKPIPEDERPATPEPEWTIPPNDFPEPENNWANAYATTYQVPAKNKLQRKTYDIGSFIQWFCRRTGKKKLCKADLEGPAFNLVKAFHKNSVFLQFQMDECHKLLTNKVDLVNPEGHQILRNIYEPLPLGGPPGQLKAARYLDFGLEELVPSLWVESERDYDISAAYGITHWWFRRKEFYINKHSEPYISVKQSRSDAILSLDQNRVGDLQLGIESYQTKINLERPNWDAADYYFKEDYTIVPKPRAVVYRDKNDQRKLMRLNELHKFSDGTLTRVMEKLDHMVKDFHLFEYNKGMETRKWSEDDKRRSKDFITAIEKRLQIRRIFRSLESFVGGRIRDIDYRLINRTTFMGKENVPIDRPAFILYWSYKVVRLEHPSETKVFHNEDGNPARANIKQALVQELTDNLKMEMEMEIPVPEMLSVKASANSDIVYFFTSAQDGDPLQDDVRLCLGDDLKKAQDHNQRQVKDESKDHYPKCKIANLQSLDQEDDLYEFLTRAYHYDPGPTQISGSAPTDQELRCYFNQCLDDNLEQSLVNRTIPSATTINAQVVPSGTSLSTTITQNAPSTSVSCQHPICILQSDIKIAGFQACKIENFTNLIILKYGISTVAQSMLWLIAHKWIYKVKLDEFVICTNRGHQNTFNANAATKNRSSIGWMSKQFYLNGDLQEKSLSSHPEGFEDQDKSTARLSSEEALMG